jgi:hypothetical protein
VIAAVKDLHPLSACHGYAVCASDGLAGEVDTPLFPAEGAPPDYLVLRITCRGRLLPRFPVLPVVLVEHVDDARGRITVAADRSTIETLPSKLPAAAAGLLGSPQSQTEHVPRPEQPFAAALVRAGAAGASSPRRAA